MPPCSFIRFSFHFHSQQRLALNLVVNRRRRLRPEETSAAATRVDEAAGGGAATMERQATDAAITG